MADLAAQELALKLELMAVDIQLKRTQAFWETPRNIAILLATVGALCSAGAGWLGYNAGRTPAAAPQPIVIYMQAAPVPGVPAAAPEAR